MVQFVFHPFQWLKSTYFCINNESFYVLNTVMNTKLQLMSKFSRKYPLQPFGNAKIVTLMVKLACKREKNQVPT